MKYILDTQVETESIQFICICMYHHMITCPYLTYSV